MTGITDTLSNYIATLKQIETLKETSKQCDDAAKDLKKRAEEAALNGVASSRITELQKECATKICMTKVAGYAIAVCCRRSENILAFLNQLYNAVKEVAK
jgi:queuine/archaeosine tRNA-ribosyltransferase